MDSEDQSAYWFLKGEMQSRAPLNQMDLEQIMEMLQNVPKKEMDDAIEQAEMMGDEAAMIVLVMADNRRKFREEYASENGELSVEKTTNFFAALKAQNPDLARKIEFSVKNYDDLPRKEIESAGFDYDKIEEWVDYVGSEDANLVDFEPCSDCEGDGYVMVGGSYFGGDRYDPPDADFEECEACAGSGEIDPADYMDKDGNYMAESFGAEEKPFIVYGEYKNGQRIKLGVSATARGAKRIVKNKENAGILNFDKYESYGFENANDYYFNEGAYDAESFNSETKSMNPYLLGAGIFALTLGILSRKV